MPFCKRTVLPKDVCKPDGRRLLEARPRQQAEIFGDLADVCGFTLCSVLRQLSDLSRHSVSILQELEGELVSVCHRSGALEGRVVRLQRHVAELVSKPPPRTTSGLEAESGRRGGSSSSHGDGNHSSSSGGGGGSSSSGGAAHFRSPWQQSVNVFGSWSRPECVEELHQQAQLNLQSLLQDFEEQLYDTKLTGQTFRHPSSQSSDDTSTSLSRSPISLNNKRPDFIFLPASKQLYDDETTSSVFGLRSVTDPSPSPSPSPCGSDRPPLGWSSNNSSSSTATSATTGPPVADKPRWQLGRRIPGHFIPLDITGEGRGGKFHGVDLLQHSPSPSPSPGDPFPHQPRSLEPVTDTLHQNLPLRKTHSDLDTTLPADNNLEQSAQDQLHLGIMDHSGLLCSNTPSASWNGPKGSTFSPGAWNEPYKYSTNKGPAVPPKQHTIIGNSGGGTQDGVMLVSSGQPASSHSSSFTSVTNPSGRGGNNIPGISLATAMMGKRSETEGAAADGGRGGGGGGGGVGEAGRGRERSARSIAAANAFKFRERSLSTPTDSGSFCFTEGGLGQPDGNVLPTGNGNALAITDQQQQHHNFLGLGENYALLYPRGSSEDSASTTDTISVTASDYSADGRLRLRSRSISLKKSKRKPPPPVRSVSLMKNLGEAEGRIHHESSLYRDGRPKSLHIPRDHFPDFQPDFLLPSSSKPIVAERELGHGGPDGPPSLEIQAPEREGETELTFPTHWQLGEWKNDPYRSLSGSSTATGTTVIECMKVRGSSESLLDSPSTSRATSPSQLSMETDIKASSPFKPPGLMSPSSGYSSQSETPTPTVPLSQMAGQGTVGTTGTAMTLGCKLRPKIPERKSSLPSPKDPAARSRLSFEMPGNAHLELSSIKPKQKASRRHSDTSTAAKPGKISPSSSQALPVVTQNELKTIRLRSVSRGDLEDCPDGASDTIEEEQHNRDLGEDPSPPPTLPKPKPPVAVKPPLPKRPLNLLLKSPSPSSTSPLALDSPPASPVDRPVPLGNIYKVMKKPKPKKPPPQTTSPSGLPDSTTTPQTAYDHQFLPHSQSLFDLPPLPDPQPLLEDPALEPEFDVDPEIRSGEGGSLPSPCSNQEAPELQDKSKTLPSRMTISCLAELSDKKKPKVPPPVPKKPNVLLLPSSVHSSTNGSTERQTPQADSPVGLRSPVGAFPPEELPGSPSVPDMLEQEENHLDDKSEEESSKESSLQSSLQDSSLTELGGKMASTGIGADDSTANEKTVLHIAEETDDDLLASTPATHTTEDLFTIIHRSKRKVLGRKEPTDSFGSRQSLVSPVKHSTSGSDLRNLTLGSSQRSSSRNENFMALLQKKGSKSSSGGARVSAMELLKSTNPLARRVTEFSNTTSTGEGGDAASGNGKPNDQ